MPNNRGTIVGVFEDPGRADRAVEDLLAAGFSTKQIGHAVRQGEEEDNLRMLDQSDAEEKEEGKAEIVAGGVAGGLLGAAAMLLIPGVGPVLASGVLAGMGIGAALGAAAGGLLGGFLHLGLSEEAARRYEREVHLGRIVVTVHAHERGSEAQEILARHGAIDVSDPVNNPLTNLTVEKLDELG
jgi:hypothetical protein